MAGVILRAAGLKDYYFKSYTLEIIDREAVDVSATSFEVGPQGVEIDHQGSTNDPHSRIITSTLVFTMFIEDNPVHEWFKNELAVAEENRFIVKLFLGVELQFVGTIVVDTVVWEDQDYPYTLQINAVDGLIRLKDIEYVPKPLLNIDYRLPMLTHIVDIINLLDMSDAFGDLAALQVAAYWYEDRMENTTSNPLSMIDFSYRPFAEEKGLNQYKYMSAWDALEQMALLLNARFYHANGRYIFEQINYRTENVNTNWFYKYDGQLIGALPISNEAEVNGAFNDLFKEQGGAFTMIPPVRTVRLIYKFKANANYLFNNLDTWKYPFWQEELVGFVEQDDTEDIRLLIGGKFKWQFFTTAFPVPILPVPAWKIRVKLVIRVGDKWLKRERANTFFDPFPDPTYNPVEWSDTFAYYYIETPIIYNNGQLDGIEDIVILTPILEDYGEIRFDFIHDTILIADANGLNEEDYFPSGYEWRWWYQYPTMFTTLADGSTLIPVEKTFTYNGPVNNSRKKEVTLFMGDGPNTTNLSRIRVKGASGWVESSGKWSPKGQTVDVSIQRLIILEMAALLVKPMTLMNGNIIHYNLGIGITPFRVLNYQGNRYLFMNGKISTTPADFNGTWFLMNYEPIE